MRAKQRYHARQCRPSPYDEKVALESTLYGLPMVQLQGPAATRSSEITRKVTRAPRTIGGRSTTGLSFSWPISTPVTGDGGNYYTLEREYYERRPAAHTAATHQFEELSGVDTHLKGSLNVNTGEHGWYVLESAVVDTNNNRVVLTLTDGGIGDSDSRDGVIGDPGGESRAWGRG